MNKTIKKYSRDYTLYKLQEKMEENKNIIKEWKKTKIKELKNARKWKYEYKNRKYETLESALVAQKWASPIDNTLELKEKIKERIKYLKNVEKNGYYKDKSGEYHVSIFKSPLKTATAKKVGAVIGDYEQELDNAYGNHYFWKNVERFAYLTKKQLKEFNEILQKKENKNPEINEMDLLEPEYINSKIMLTYRYSWYDRLNRLHPTPQINYVGTGDEVFDKIQELQEKEATNDQGVYQLLKIKILKKADIQELEESYEDYCNSCNRQGIEGPSYKEYCNKTSVN